MNREQALELLQQHLKNKNLIKHSLAVEACMRSVAERFKEDPHEWGIAGLLHDLDYEYTADHPEQHGLKTAEMLRDKDISDQAVHAIMAHNEKAGLDSAMDRALYAIDPTTGFIIACALMHPDKKLAPLDLKFMKKRFKAKAFARGASREQMRTCENMGIELDEFLQVCLDAMTAIAGPLGL